MYQEKREEEDLPVLKTALTHRYDSKTIYKNTEDWFQTRHDWVGKVIHWDICKKFKFDHTNKWYIHNPASVLENDAQTPMGLWHTDGSPNLGQKTRPNNYQQQKKRIWKIVDFAVPVDYRIKLKEFEKKDKYLDLASELKKTMEHEADSYTNCDWYFWYSNKTIIK